MSAKSKRGRPVKDVNKVSINDLVVEFLATKENDYNANICYFKVVDVECKTKMKSIIGLQDDDLRMPFWKSVDKQELILKVKGKFVNAASDLVKGSLYAIGIYFESYNIEQEDKEPIKGYYAKVSNVKPLKTPPGIEIVENDGN